MKRRSKSEIARRRSQQQRSLSNNTKSKQEKDRHNSGNSRDSKERSKSLNWKEMPAFGKVSFILIIYIAATVIGFVVGIFWGGGLGLFLFLMGLFYPAERVEDEPEPELGTMAGLFLILGAILNFFFMDNLISGGVTLGELFGLEEGEEPPTWVAVLMSLALLSGIVGMTIKFFFKFLQNNENDDPEEIDHDV